MQIWATKHLHIMTPEVYKELRVQIHELLIKREVQYTQAEIADELTRRAVGWIFSAKDVNYLKNIRNKRWKGDAKSKKLLAFYDCLSKFSLDITNEQTINISQEEQEHILFIVQQAVALEFEVFQSIPSIENQLEQFSTYVTTEGTAYEKVRQIAQRQIERGWIINNHLNPSHFDLLDFKISKTEGNTAYVKTDEYWFLKWFDPASKSYAYLYENRNTQLYVLKKKEQQWKIFTNIYSTNVKRTPPPTSPAPTPQIEHINQLTDYINTQLLANNLSGALSPILDFTRQIEDKELYHKSLQLNIKLKETQRFFNINHIGWQEFVEEKTKLTKDILQLLEELQLRSPVSKLIIE